MSCLDPILHQQHGDAFRFSTDTRTMCLACLFTSLKDPEALYTCKAHAIAQLSELLNDEEHGHSICQFICTQFSAYLVMAMVEALMALHEDPGLTASLSATALQLSATEPMFADMLAEALLQSCKALQEGTLLGRRGQQSQAIHPGLSCQLQLLGAVLEASPSASSVATRYLASDGSLIEACMAALQSLDPLDDTYISMLRLLQAVFSPGTATSSTADLIAHVGHQCLAHAVSVLASLHKKQSHSAVQIDNLRVNSLALIEVLLAAGCMQCDASSTQKLPGPQWGQLAANLLSGIKPCLLASGKLLQVQAAQLLVHVCSTAHPQLLQLLVSHDLIEYLCECARTSLIRSSGQTAPAANTRGAASRHVAAQAAGGAHTALHSQAPGGRYEASGTDWEALQSLVLTALRSLAEQVDVFSHRIALGMDTLIRVGEAAATSHNTPVLADALALMLLAAAPRDQGPATGGSSMSQADMRSCMKLAAKVFPASVEPRAAQQHVVLSREGQACCSSACHLASVITQCWGRGASVKLNTHTAQQQQQLVWDVMASSCGGLTSISPPSLYTYLEAASTLLHTWVTWIPPGNEQHVLGVLGLVSDALLPALSRCMSVDVSTCAPPDDRLIRASLSAAAVTLLLATQGSSTGSTCVEAGRNLALQLLQNRWCSTCMELMAHMPETAASCWQFLIALQQGALQIPGQPCPDLQQLVQLPPGSVADLGDQLAGLLSWEAVLQQLALHGPYSGSVHLSTAPLVMMTTALMSGDPPCPDLPWLHQALVRVMSTCCPAAQHQHQYQQPHTGGQMFTAAGDARGPRDESRDESVGWHVVRAALKLYLQVADQLSGAPPASQPAPHSHPPLGPGASGLQGLGPDLRQTLVSVVTRYVEWEPGCVELGGPLAGWMLAHACDVPSLVRDQLFTWLDLAAQASHNTRAHVHHHLAQHAAACPHVLQLLISLLSRDGAHTSGSARGGEGVHRQEEGVQQGVMCILQVIMTHRPQVVQHLVQLGTLDILRQHVLHLTSRLSRLLMTTDGRQPAAPAGGRAGGDVALSQAACQWPRGTDSKQPGSNRATSQQVQVVSAVTCLTSWLQLLLQATVLAAEHVTHVPAGSSHAGAEFSLFPGDMATETAHSTVGAGNAGDWMEYSQPLHDWHEDSYAAASRQCTNSNPTHLPGSTSSAHVSTHVTQVLTAAAQLLHLVVSRLMSNHTHTAARGPSRVPHSTCTSAGSSEGAAEQGESEGGQHAALLLCELDGGSQLVGCVLQLHMLLMTMQVACALPDDLCLDITPACDQVHVVLLSALDVVLPRLLHNHVTTQLCQPATTSTDRDPSDGQSALPFASTQHDLAHVLHGGLLIHVIHVIHVMEAREQQLPSVQLAGGATKPHQPSSRTLDAPWTQLALALKQPQLKSCGVLLAWLCTLKTLISGRCDVAPPDSQQATNLQFGDSELSCVVMALHDAAADPDLATRSAGCLGLCALDTWSLRLTHTPDTAAVGPAAVLCRDVWGPTLLRETLLQLPGKHRRYQETASRAAEDGARPETDTAVVLASLMSDVMLLVAMLPRASSRGEAFPGGFQHPRPECGSWVQEVWACLLHDPCVGPDLLALLVHPPAPLQPFINALVGSLAATTGLLGAGVLKQMVEVYRAQLWSGAQPAAGRGTSQETLDRMAHQTAAAVDAGQLDAHGTTGGSQQGSYSQAHLWNGTAHTRALESPGAALCSEAQAELLRACVAGSGQAASCGGMQGGGGMFRCELLLPMLMLLCAWSKEVQGAMPGPGSQSSKLGCLLPASRFTASSWQVLQAVEGAVGRASQCEGSQGD